MCEPSFDVFNHTINKEVMEEVENMSVMQEDVAQSSAADIPQEENVVESTPKLIEDRPEINWKKEIERKEQRFLRELEKRDVMLEKLVSQMSGPKTQVDELDQIQDDEWIDKAKSKKIVRNEVAPLEKKIADLETQLLVSSLRSKYPDFNDVVNPETIALLEEHEPELAESIVALRDPYKMNLQTYKFIKSSGILDKVSNSRHKNDVERKLEKSSKTVQTPQAYEKRPMAQAFVLTEAQKKAEANALYEEMMHFSRNGGGY